MKHIALSLLFILAAVISCAAKEEATATFGNKEVIHPNDSTIEVHQELEYLDDDHHVVQNAWKSNWFILADAGVNAFFGDKHVGDFKYRLSPQFNFGVGKWVLPGFGLSLGFTGFRSHSHKSVDTDLYTRDEPLQTDNDGNQYYQENIKWWDLSINAKFNVTRLIYGYEGDLSGRYLNDFFVTVGIGATHHYGLSYGSANEWSGRLELQYSRFFNRKKAFSLDLKLRGMFYDSNYDGYRNRQKTDLIDCNISLNVGFTYYFPYRGWKQKTTHTTILKEYHQHNEYNKAKIIELNQEIDRLRNMPVSQEVIAANIAETINEVGAFPYLVNFQLNQTDVVNRERVNLSVVAAIMKATPDQKYVITGYADNTTGTPERNEWLAFQRAQNTIKVLTEEFDVPADQLILQAKGGVDNMYYDDPQLSRSAIITLQETAPAEKNNK